MNYIQKNLLMSEKLIYIIRPHWVIFSSATWAMLGSIFLWIFVQFQILDFHLFSIFTARDIAALILFFVGVYWFLCALIYYNTSEYGVTNKRVLIKTGWIQRKSLEIMLDKVEGVLVDQTIAGRIFGYGDITIIGTGGTRDTYPYIPDPLRFRKEVQQQVEFAEERFMHPSV